MKRLLRRLLISISALYFTSQLLPSLSITGGLRGYLFSALAFMLADLILIPLLKILFLPLNLLTLGLFAWLTNVLALYILVTVVPTFRVLPYSFAGVNWGWIILPAAQLSTFQVVIVASLIIGVIIHLVNWLIH